MSFQEFEVEAKERIKGVRVRSGGSKLVVLTFSSKQQMNKERVRMDVWISRWSDSITGWRKGKLITTERCV